MDRRTNSGIVSCAVIVPSKSKSARAADVGIASPCRLTVELSGAHAGNREWHFIPHAGTSFAKVDTHG